MLVVSPNVFKSNTTCFAFYLGLIFFMFFFLVIYGLFHLQLAQYLPKTYKIVSFDIKQPLSISLYKVADFKRLRHSTKTFSCIIKSPPFSLKLSRTSSIQERHEFIQNCKGNGRDFIRKVSYFIHPSFTIFKSSLARTIER